MTTSEIIMAVIAIFTLIGGVLKCVHEFENDRADRKAFEKRIIAMLEMIQGQYAEIQKQVEASREDRRLLDKRLGILEEALRLEHARIDSINSKIEALYIKFQ